MNDCFSDGSAGVWSKQKAYALKSRGSIAERLEGGLMSWAKILGAAALITAGMTGTAAAYHDDNARGGSYRNSCRAIYESRGVIYAECRTSSGRYVRTSISARCRGDIYNSGGRLYCRGDYAYRDRDRYSRYDRRYRNDYGYRESRYAPRGSYRNSCRGAFESRGVLYAECRNSSGRYVRTSLSLRSCSGDIYNSRGRLYCEGRYGYYRR
jgi:hypothetical protein